MPVVSRFFGIVIAFYWEDHLPPHFHAKYGGDEGLIDIRTGPAPARNPGAADAGLGPRVAPGPFGRTVAQLGTRPAA